MTAALAACILAFTGCSAHEAALRNFHEHKYAEARDGLQELVNEGDKDFAMYAAEYGIVLMFMGDLEHARKVLQVTSEVMNTPGGDELRGWGSLVINASLKRFKGEPFEKAMVDFYVGVLSWLMGDGETARVGFRRTILADQRSKEGARDDFAPADFLYGMSARTSGDLDTLRIGLRKAGVRWPKNPYLKEPLAGTANLIVLLEVGQGPRKIASGWMGSFDDFVPVPPPYVGAAVSVDGAPRGDAAQLLDLYFQARGRPEAARDVVQGVKAGVRTGALGVAAVSGDWRVQLFSLLFAIFYPSEADTRQVGLLPGYMLVWAGRLPAGKHEVVATFRPASGGPGTFQIRWTGVDVTENGVTLLFGRGGYGQIAQRTPEELKKEGKGEKNGKAAEKQK